MIQEVSSASLPPSLIPNIKESFFIHCVRQNKTLSWCYTFCCGYCQDSVSPNCRYDTGFLHSGVRMAVALDEKVADLPEFGRQDCDSIFPDVHQYSILSGQ